VNHDGQLRGARQFHLPDEDGLLGFSRGMIIKIVEPDFAPGDDFRFSRQLLQFSKSRFTRQFGFVCMNPNRGVHELVLRRQLDATVESARPVAVSDGNDCFDSGFPRAGNYLLAVCVELLAIEMGVRIDEHHRNVDVDFRILNSTFKTQPSTMELLQSRPYRHILEETGQHCFPTLSRRSYDHAIRLEPAKLAGRQIGDDHDFAAH